MMKTWACVAWVAGSESAGMSIRVMENAYGAGSYQDHEGPLGSEYVHQVNAPDMYDALGIALQWFVDNGFTNVKTA